MWEKIYSGFQNAGSRGVNITTSGKQKFPPIKKQLCQDSAISEVTYLLGTCMISWWWRIPEHTLKFAYHVCIYLIKRWHPEFHAWFWQSWLLIGGSLFHMQIIVILSYATLFIIATYGHVIGSVGPNLVANTLYRVYHHLDCVSVFNTSKYLEYVKGFFRANFLTPLAFFVSVLSTLKLYILQRSPTSSLIWPPHTHIYLWIYLLIFPCVSEVLVVRRDHGGVGKVYRARPDFEFGFEGYRY